MRIAAFYEMHDSAVCSINDGTIDFFCKEERLTRVKRDKNPEASLEVLKNLKKDIDLFLFCTPTNEYDQTNFPNKKRIEKSFNTKVLNYSSLNHHLCHASLAHYNSKFDTSLVFVIDRNGSVYFLDGEGVARESESIFLCTGVNSFVPLYKNFWIREKNIHDKHFIKKSIQSYYTDVEIEADSYLSIVKVYEAATTLIGQHTFDNGKTMGLSSYGKKMVTQYYFDDIPVENKFFPYYPNGSINIEPGQISFNDYFDRSVTQVDPNNYQFYADRALEVQTQTQEQVLRLIQKYVDKTGVKNVCLVGGYALNVVANGFYVKNMPGVNFYFEPIADDTGISIGGCMLEYANATHEKPKPIETPFFHYYDDTENLNIGKETEIEEIVNLLKNGKSVALFDGNPESGPRALGHRSIIFDPRNKDSKKIVNAIKKREWYRPFAGTILEEDFEKYFDTMGIKKSPNMTINFFAKEGVKYYVPGIIHVDNSCRIQTVNQGFLYDLLKKFKESTLCPMLLNTSFNLAGQPLVQTKMQAIDTLNQSSLDAVYFVQDKKLVFKT